MLVELGCEVEGMFAMRVGDLAPGPVVGAGCKVEECLDGFVELDTKLNSCAERSTWGPGASSIVATSWSYFAR